MTARSDPFAHLDRLCAEFPAFHIVLEPTADNTIRFVARNRHQDVHPRTVVTSDVAELRAALSTSGAVDGGRAGAP